MCTINNNICYFCLCMSHLNFHVYGVILQKSVINISKITGYFREIKYDEKNTLVPLFQPWMVEGKIEEI